MYDGERIEVVEYDPWPHNRPPWKDYPWPCDSDDWIINIVADLDPGIECCIYRVPKRIREVNEAAYTPQVVSIGPFHYGKKELKDMEEHKGRYAREFFKRTTPEKYVEVLAFIKNREQQVRNCYSETCELESDEYLLMILRDAIFIIELLLRYYEEEDDDVASDFLLSIPAERIALRLDLQLLENQLPYFLLEGLYKLVVSEPSFITLCFKFFKDLMFDSVPEETEFKHFTDLRRSALVKSYLLDQEFDDHKYPETDLPSAVKLYESGVKFKAVNEKDQCLLDIRFEVDELRIPHLKVFEETETILRNIMALEQCRYPYATPVCAYVELLHFLINTNRDVDLLIKKGILSNYLGEKTQLVSLFKKLCSHIPVSKPYYYKIHKALKAHYDVPWNRAMVYIKERWRGVSTVAAIVVLLLSFTQAITSIIQIA